MDRIYGTETSNIHFIIAIACQKWTSFEASDLGGVLHNRVNHTMVLRPPGASGGSKTAYTGMQQTNQQVFLARIGMLIPYQFYFSNTQHTSLEGSMACNMQTC